MNAVQIHAATIIIRV